MAILVVLFLAVSGLLFGLKIFFLNLMPKGTPGEIISAGMLPLYNIFVGIEVVPQSDDLPSVIFKEEISK
jgi:hypothetical protein